MMLVIILVLHAQEEALITVQNVILQQIERKLETSAPVILGLWMMVSIRNAFFSPLLNQLQYAKFKIPAIIHAILVREKGIPIACPVMITTIVN